MQTFLRIPVSTKRRRRRRRRVLPSASCTDRSITHSLEEGDATWFCDEEIRIRGSSISRPRGNQLRLVAVVGFSGLQRRLARLNRELKDPPCKGGYPRCFGAPAFAFLWRASRLVPTVMWIAMVAVVTVSSMLQRPQDIVIFFFFPASKLTPRNGRFQAVAGSSDCVCVWV